MAEQFIPNGVVVPKITPKRSGANLGGAWNYSGDVTGAIRVPRTGGPSSVVRRLLDNSGGPFSKL